MKRLALLLLPVLLAAPACATSHNVHVAPIQVAPIRMTMDVNVNVHETTEAAEDEDDADARAERERERTDRTGS